MINYKLAKELKEAGFPQEGKGFTTETINREVPQEQIDGRVYYPTLSELMDECGDRSWQLVKNKKLFAMAIINEEDDIILGDYSKTKEEAAVKLWLKLNNK